MVLRRQQKRRVVAGRAGIKESGRAKPRYVRVVVAGGALSAVPQKGCSIKRQQNRDAARRRFRKNLCGRVVEPSERICRGRVSRFAGRGLLLVERGQRGARRVPVHVDSNNARARHYDRRRGGGAGASGAAASGAVAFGDVASNDARPVTLRPVSLLVPAAAPLLALWLARQGAAWRDNSTTMCCARESACSNAPLVDQRSAACISSGRLQCLDDRFETVGEAFGIEIQRIVMTVRISASSAA